MGQNYKYKGQAFSHGTHARVVEVGFERNSGTLQPKQHNTKNIFWWCITFLTELFYLDIYEQHTSDISNYITWKGHPEPGDTMIYSLYMVNEVDFNHIKPLSEILG